MASSTISGVTTKLAILREGEYLNFTVGDVLKDGDVLVNNTDAPLRVSSLLNPEGENFQQVMLEPGGTTKVIHMGEDHVAFEALDGAVLETTDEIEADSADVVLHDETTLFGLVAGGGGLAAGLLALGGAGAAAALAGSDGSDDNTVVIAETNDTNNGPTGGGETGGPTSPPPPPVSPPPVSPPPPPPAAAGDTVLLAVNPTNSTATVAGMELTAGEAGDPANNVVIATANQENGTVGLGDTNAEGEPTADMTLVAVAQDNAEFFDSGLPGEVAPEDALASVTGNLSDMTLVVDGGGLADAAAGGLADSGSALPIGSASNPDFTLLDPVLSQLPTM